MKKVGIIWWVVCLLCAIVAGVLFYDWRKDTATSIDSRSTISETASVETKATALLAGGCFWCVEADLEKVDGVISAVSGYTSGSTKNPEYGNYAEGGHREVVLVTYDPAKVSFDNLVEHLIKHSDPTDALGSFYDRGFQYAPAVYYGDDQEKQIAEKVISEIDGLRVYEKPLALMVLSRDVFWPAEEYHQDYYKKNPIRYTYYRNASGRDAFIKKHWGDKAGLFARPNVAMTGKTDWMRYVRPSDAVLRERLTPLQYKVTQEEGTERPFDNEYNTNKAEGIYVDIVSGEPLFSSRDKYDSGTGWPSFVKPITEDAVVLREDRSLFGTRVEVRSRYADSHVGHVFDDGPKDRGGKRYCMNSAAMRFVPKDKIVAEGYGEYLQTL